MALDVIGPAGELKPGGYLRRILLGRHEGLIRIDILPRAQELLVRVGIRICGSVWSVWGLFSINSTLDDGL
jgi:hypothetical protein